MQLHENGLCLLVIHITTHIHRHRSWPQIISNKTGNSLILEGQPIRGTTTYGSELRLENQS